MFKRKVVLAIGAAVVVALLLATPILADSGHGKKASGSGIIDDKPGWGYGDNNHTHEGPPGQDH